MARPHKPSARVHRQVTNRLRVLRAERGWPQEHVAKKLGMPSRYRFWQIENDEADPTPRELAKLCKMFRCSVTDIYPHLKVAAPSSNTAA